MDLAERAAGLITIPSALMIVSGGLLAAIAGVLVRNRAPGPKRHFFAYTLVIAALIYVLFAVYGLVDGTADLTWLGIEIAGVALFGVFAASGTKRSAMLLAAGWALHVLWDVVPFHGTGNSFVPDAYRSLCIGFDLVFAGFIAYYFHFRSKP